MTAKQVYDCLNRAIAALFREDSYLLKVDASERSISHRLAVHLTSEFPDYDVDCEYNREGFDVKRLALSPQPTQSDEDSAVTVFPDIVVHRRGTNDHNLIVLEMKKESSTVSAEHDNKKLSAFVREMGYVYAVHITVGIDPWGAPVKKIEWTSPPRWRPSDPRTPSIMIDSPISDT